MQCSCLVECVTYNIKDFVFVRVEVSLCMCVLFSRMGAFNHFQCASPSTRVPFKIDPKPEL